MLDLYLTQVANMDIISTPYKFKDTSFGEEEISVKEKPYDDDCVMYADPLHPTYERNSIRIYAKFVLTIQR